MAIVIANVCNAAARPRPQKRMALRFARRVPGIKLSVAIAKVFSLYLGDAVMVDPLVIHVEGAPAQLQDLRFAFDLHGAGQTGNVPPLAGNRGYLALDTNANGRIDNGLEWFGPDAGNRFAELAPYDSDRHGRIDDADPVFQQLQVWSPEVDGGGNLRSLRRLELGALSVTAVATLFALRTADNASLGVVRSTSASLQENGSAGTVQQAALTA